MFGYSDPEQNKLWSKQYGEFREEEDARQKSGFVDTVEQAARSGLGALGHAASNGETLDPALGTATGVLLGHVSTDPPPQAAVAGRNVPESMVPNRDDDSQRSSGDALSAVIAERFESSLRDKGEPSRDRTLR